MNKRRKLFLSASEAVSRDLKELGHPISKISTLSGVPYATLHRFINFDRDPHVRGPRILVIKKLIALSFWSDHTAVHLQNIVDFDDGKVV